MSVADTRSAVARGIEALPQRTSSDIKHHWGAVARQAREVGRLAITTHQTVELVVMSVEEYSSLMTTIQETKNRDQTLLDELTSRFDARLADLQMPDAEAKVDRFFAAGGKSKARPKAGSF